MFPLGNVLFPGQQLPLQIFEPRYQVMIAEVLAGDGEFGVVLIERGHEVGGGDQRSNIGCVAVVERAQQIDDGRVGVLARGVERLMVEQWLPDDPYPIANVIRLPRGTTSIEGHAGSAQVRLQLQELVALVAPGEEVAVPSGQSVEQFVDWVSATVGFGAWDAQQLLMASTVDEQIAVLATLLADAIGLRRLQQGDR